MSSRRDNEGENTIVRLILQNDAETYDCVGVLMEESDEWVRVAFNAIDGIARDDLQINRSEIISMTPLKHEEIAEISVR